MSSILIKNDKDDNYGLYIDYPIDIDGDVTNNDWKIFYSDDTNVFIITDDYIPSSKIGASKITAAGLTTLEIYNVYWKYDDVDNLNYSTPYKAVNILGEK